jgi:transcriptional regulator with XRE-family HTH domain
MTLYNPIGGFSTRLQELRKEQGLSQNALAKALNSSQKTISAYETGESSPTIQTILKIADFLNVSTDYLLGRSDFKKVMPPRRNNYTWTDRGELYPLVIENTGNEIDINMLSDMIAQLSSTEQDAISTLVRTLFCSKPKALNLGIAHGGIFPATIFTTPEDELTNEEKVQLKSYVEFLKTQRK